MRETFTQFISFSSFYQRQRLSAVFAIVHRGKRIYSVNNGNDFSMSTSMDIIHDVVCITVREV